MKPIITLLLAGGLCLEAQAQVPVSKSVPIINKTTATWCGPCGQWGWELFDEIITDNKPKAILMGTYGDEASDLFNQTAGDFYDDFCSGAGWPAFAVNGANRTAYSSSGGIYTSTTRNNCKMVSDSFAATTPLASTGYTYKITGNTLTVNTKTKFWQATSGNYFVGVYVIEDGVMNTQAGQSGTVAHHYVLRGSISAGASFGVSIVNGSVTSGQTYDKSFTYTLPANWNKSKLQVVTMIWKKSSGPGYDFINANNKADVPASVASLDDNRNIALYPNPASREMNLQVNLEERADITYSVTSATGQVVAHMPVNREASGTHLYTISTGAWASGTYLVTLRIGEKMYSGRLVVAH